MSVAGSDSYKAWEKGMNSAPNFLFGGGQQPPQLITTTIAPPITVQSNGGMSSGFDLGKLPPKEGFSNNTSTRLDNNGFSMGNLNRFEDQNNGGLKMEAIAKQFNKPLPFHQFNNIGIKYQQPQNNTISQTRTEDHQLQPPNPYNSGIITSNNLGDPTVTAEDSNKKTKWFCTIIKNPLFIALMAAIVVMLALALINPPFIKKKVTNPIYKASTDPIKILVWGSIAGIAVYLLPILQTKLFKK